MGTLPSPSSRRAWIEISAQRTTTQASPVALLAEGVDRNNLFTVATFQIFWSPSSRRAWIEIYPPGSR